MIRILKPADTHIHLRQGNMLTAVVKHIINQYHLILPMPNTDPPILTGTDAVVYETQIRTAGFSGKVIKTIKLTPKTTPEIIRDAYALGVRAAKLYPDGVTTGSTDGVKDFVELDPVYDEMEHLGMHLLLHGEMPGVFVLDAEKAFLVELKRIAWEFPKLKITLEHITTKDAVDAVMALPKNVSATITAHHLFLTLDDVIGGARIHPHNFCKPVAKRHEDRDVLIWAAISGNPKFRLGSDSAPHRKELKECAEGCAGVYTSPILMALLVEFFTRYNSLHMINNFCTNFGLAWFDQPTNDVEELTVIEKSWVVPAHYDGVVPFMAGKTLHYLVG